MFYNQLRSRTNNQILVQTKLAKFEKLLFCFW